MVGNHNSVRIAVQVTRIKHSPGRTARNTRICGGTTKIQNSAGIYFDFNAPVLTNTTVHTVSKNLVSAIVDKSIATSDKVKVYPNPASGTMTFELKDAPNASSKTQFQLYDSIGKQVISEQFSGKTFDFHRQSLPSGIYLFRMTMENQIVGIGKLMIQ